MKKIWLCGLLAYSLVTVAQQDTTDLIDYSRFGDALGVKRYCSQKVLNQTPQRIVSIGYEQQSSFTMPHVPLSAMLPAMQDLSITRVSSLRAQLNIPVISNTRLIWQWGANYWASRFVAGKPSNNLFTQSIEQRSLTSAGINTTIFKPLNEKNFFIVQASIDANGVFEGLQDINGRSMTLSATGIYGWKTSEKNMIGAGLARTYRAGQVMHLPVLLWNKTFNDKWGMELLLPARGHLRYNFSTASMLQAGFELEGNQFWMRLSNSPNGTVYIQRGELKPRLQWDKKITGFFWLNAQAGLRYNWRFDVMNQYNAKDPGLRYFTSALGNPLYLSFSLHFVSP